MGLPLKKGRGRRLEGPVCIRHTTPDHNITGKGLDQPPAPGGGGGLWGGARVASATGERMGQGNAGEGGLRPDEGERSKRAGGGGGASVDIPCSPSPPPPPRALGWHRLNSA